MSEPSADAGLGCQPSPGTIFATAPVHMFVLQHSTLSDLFRSSLLREGARGVKSPVCVRKRGDQTFQPNVPLLRCFVCCVNCFCVISGLAACGIHAELFSRISPHSITVSAGDPARYPDRQIPGLLLLVRRAAAPLSLLLAQAAPCDGPRLALGMSCAQSELLQPGQPKLNPAPKPI